MKIVLDMEPRFLEIFSKMDKSTLAEGETNSLFLTVQGIQGGRKKSSRKSVDANP